ncbi:uncharacterized protein LOC111629230 [Centruroides sculpturatus]|uniref:uncharacterized protein LOC111629230 n=1 Tax=Centruroides sculpturatus TaxID=218467 RepID=UPI000C6CC237|nr:uncharacterized protein LOC111629230 [Centruroides sculpturatus]
MLLASCRPQVYIALFVCLVIKAFHLELVSSLTTTVFISALKRFIARRSKCHQMISDNVTNFVDAAAEIKTFFRDLKVQESVREYGLSEGFDWKFIPPRASHFGGLWESGIKSMKSHLKKVIGETILNFKEYCTLLSQIEACLNSRPLCPLVDDPQSLEPLIPGHFLIGRPLCSIPESSLLFLPVGRLPVGNIFNK